MSDAVRNVGIRLSLTPGDVAGADELLGKIKAVNQGVTVLKDNLNTVTSEMGDNAGADLKSVGDGVKSVGDGMKVVTDEASRMKTSVNDAKVVVSEVADVTHNATKKTADGFKRAGKAVDDFSEKVLGAGPELPPLNVDDIINDIRSVGGEYEGLAEQVSKIASESSSLEEAKARTADLVKEFHQLQEETGRSFGIGERTDEIMEMVSQVTEEFNALNAVPFMEQLDGALEEVAQQTRDTEAATEAMNKKFAEVAASAKTLDEVKAVGLELGRVLVEAGEKSGHIKTVSEALVLIEETQKAVSQTFIDSQGAAKAAALENMNAQIAKAAETATSVEEVKVAAEGIATEYIKWGASVGVIDKMTDAQKILTAASKTATKEFVNNEKEKEKALKDFVKVVEDAQKKQDKIAKEEAKQAEKIESLNKKRTGSFIQSGVAATQFLASIRLLGAEHESIEALAEEFVYLQAGVQAINQGHQAYKGITEGLDAMRESSKLVTASNTVCTASTATANTTMVATGAAGKTAAVGIMSMGAAIGIALPVLAAIATAHYLWRMEQKENAKEEERLKGQIEDTTKSIKLRTSSMERMFDLEKGYRDFQDQFRETPKTKKEILETLKRDKKENAEVLKQKALEATQNEIQRLMGTSVEVDGEQKNVGDERARLIRELAESQAIMARSKAEAQGLIDQGYSETSGKVTRATTPGVVARRRADELKGDIGQLELSSGIRTAKRAEKIFSDGTTTVELNQQAKIAGGSGSQEFAKVLGGLFADGEKKRLATDQKAINEADKSRQYAEREAEDARRQAKDTDASIVKEEQLAINRQRFDDDASNAGLLDEAFAQVAAAEGMGSGQEDAADELLRLTTQGDRPLLDTDDDKVEAAIKKLRDTGDTSGVRTELKDAATFNVGEGGEDTNDAHQRTSEASGDMVDAATRRADEFERLRDGMLVATERENELMEDILRMQGAQ